MKRLSVFAEAESKMAVREVEVSAREEAMEARVNGGVAEHLDTMLAAQADTRDVMEARRKEIASQLGELDTIEKSWRDTVLKKEAELAQREREARGRVAAYEKKLLERDFTLKRRLMRDIRKVYNKVVGQEEECAVRDRRMAAREAEVRSAARTSKKWSRTRGLMKGGPRRPAGATKVVKDEGRALETSALAATAADKPRPYAARNLPPKKPPTPEPDFDPETGAALPHGGGEPRPAVDQARPSSRDRRDARRELGAEQRYVCAEARPGGGAGKCAAGASKKNFTSRETPRYGRVGSAAWGGRARNLEARRPQRPGDSARNEGMG